MKVLVVTLVSLPPLFWPRISCPSLCMSACIGYWPSDARVTWRGRAMRCLDSMPGPSV